MKICKKCGFVISDNSSECPACGFNYETELHSETQHNVMDVNGSRSIFIKGADLISDDALYNAGICKLNGIGMEKNMNEALELFNILAFRGHTDGMYKLAEMYLNQTPPNEEIAKKWLKIAAESGHKSSIIKLKMLGDDGSLTKKAKRPENSFYNESDSFEDRVEQASACVVAINSICQEKSQIVSSHGSGFLINGGYVISNAHVIGEKAVNIVAKFDPEIDIKEYQLEPLSVVDKYDVAVLRFKGVANERFSERQNLELRSGDVKRGEEVYTIGNPLFLGLNVSKGVVSSVHKDYRNYRSVKHVIQTDITINHGNSGGALFDKNDNVLGMMTFVPGASMGGIGMAVPSEYIEEVLSNIEKENR